MSRWNTYEYLNKEYAQKGRSTGNIAKEHGTYANTVRRALLKHGIPLRNKSEAQKNFLDKNDHPMLGSERSDETKKKISEGIQDHFDTLTDEELEKRKAEQSKRAQEKWDAMTKEERQENIAKMHRANREMSGQGSKNENLVAQLLKEAGYKNVQRSVDYSPRKQWEIDIAVPSESIAIEWDGAVHFEPIFGEKNMQRVMAKDARKEKALTGFGWTVIRCRDHSTAHSLAFCRRAVNQIIDIIKTGKRGVVHKIDVE